MAPRDDLSATMRAEVKTLLDNPFEFQAQRLPDFVLRRGPLTPDVSRFKPRFGVCRSRIGQTAV